MPEHIQYEDDDLFNPETHHESSDVPVAGLFWFIAIFIVFGVVTHFLVYFLYQGLVKGERNRMDPPQTAVARPASADVPQNQPLLQPFPRNDAKGSTLPPQNDTPIVDMQKMRAAEEQVLRNYGWVDRQNGVVHIPIEQAKAILAARSAVQGQLGVPSSPATTTAPVLPGSQPAPTGQPVPPDAGVAPPASNSTTAAPARAPATAPATTTTGGAHP